jgi:hypothetical protein
MQGTKSHHRSEYQEHALGACPGIVESIFIFCPRSTKLDGPEYSESQNQEHFVPAGANIDARGEICSQSNTQAREGVYVL